MYFGKIFASIGFKYISLSKSSTVLLGFYRNSGCCLCDAVWSRYIIIFPKPYNPAHTTNKIVLNWMDSSLIIHYMCVMYEWLLLHIHIVFLFVLVSVFSVYIIKWIYGCMMHDSRFLEVVIYILYCTTRYQSPIKCDALWSCWGLPIFCAECLALNAYEIHIYEEMCRPLHMYQITPYFVTQLHPVLGN